MSFFFIQHAISEKSRQKHLEVSHWLDYAEPKYTKKMISDIKSVLKILLLFVPLPLFWALFDQQGSRWTFQATRMDGNIGFTEIKPDQMQLINPLLILAFIPLFDCAVYPLLANFGLKRPLQKLAAGGILAGIAFLISGFVELRLEKTYPVFPRPNESQMRIFNGLPCTYELQNFSGTASDNQLSHLGLYKYSHSVNGTSSKLAVFSTSTNGCESHRSELNVTAGNSNSFFIHGDGNRPMIKSFDDKVDKSKSGNPYVRILSNLQSTNEIRLVYKNGEIAKTVTHDSTEQFEVLPEEYIIFADDTKISSVHVQVGGVYTIVVSNSSNGTAELKLYEITTPNTVHMLWLVPQYIIITAGEVMFSVTGLEFAYSQAPANMKSLLQASWLLTVALGNVIVVIIAEAKFFNSQAYEFFLFSVMMFVDMAIFGLLAMRYKYVNMHPKDDDEIEQGIPIEDTKKTFTNDAFQND